MVTCQPCVEKYTRRYKELGKDDKTARHMAKKLVKRIEKNRSLGKRQRIKNTLRNLFMIYRNYTLFLLRLNWVASLRYKRLVGLGGNSPYDYTQPCDDCIARCLLNAPCYTNEECWECRKVCPAPTDPNSYLSRSTCVCKASSTTCYCSFEAVVCAGAAPVKCATPSGICEYTCNPGYYWNGSACVPIPAVVQYGNGLTWTGCFLFLPKFYITIYHKEVIYNFSL